MKKIHIISLRVIALFVIAMLVSFIPEYLHDFFGDWTCKGRVLVYSHGHSQYIGCTYHEGTGQPTLHWGYRHWLFFFMGVILFVIQAFDIINYIDKD